MMGLSGQKESLMLPYPFQYNTQVSVTDKTNGQTPADS